VLDTIRIKGNRRRDSRVAVISSGYPMNSDYTDRIAYKSNGSSVKEILPHDLCSFIVSNPRPAD
jgi:hypothetical protein